MGDKRFRLSKLELDEISLVRSGDDPSAKVMIHKAEPITKCSPGAHKGLKKGATCPECGYVMKSMPAGGDLYIDEPLGTRRRKKRKALIDKARSIGG